MDWSLRCIGGCVGLMVRIHLKLDVKMFISTSCSLQEVVDVKFVNALSKESSYWSADLLTAPMISGDTVNFFFDIFLYVQP